MEMYSIGECPKCHTDWWRKCGGHHRLPIYYECVTCGMTTERIANVLKESAHEPHS